MTAVAEIVEDLNLLRDEELKVAAQYIHELRERSATERRAATRALRGCLKGEEGERFAEAIQEGCEQIDG